MKDIPLRDAVILHACQNQNNKRTLRLISEGYDINAGAGATWTPLIWACETMDTDMTRKLLELGADADARDGDGRTPLHHAARQNCQKSIEALIEHGADLDAVDGDGFTALHHACNLDRLEAAVILAKSGASTSIKSNGHNGKTAMQMQNGRIEQHIASVMAKQQLEGAFLDAENPGHPRKKTAKVSL